MAASSPADLPAIARAGADDPAIAALVALADAVSAALYPAESNHPLDLDRLAQPDVTLWLARERGTAQGMIALRHDREGWGEVKRMIVREAARGRGIARALLRALEAEATARGVRLLRLETGIHSHAALALYRKAGFTERGPFGSYAPDPLSVFMEKRLGEGTPR